MATYVGVIHADYTAELFPFDVWIDRKTVAGEDATMLVGIKAAVEWSATNRVIKAVQDDRAERAMEYVLKYVEKREAAAEQEAKERTLW